MGANPFRWRPVKNTNHQRYWYQRIDKRGWHTGRRPSVRKAKVVRLGSRKAWGLRVPKIRIRILSPRTLLARLRDAYVTMMMNLVGRGNMAGMAIGPMAGLQGARCQHIKSGNFTEAEIVYLEYLKRDPTFMQPAGNHTRRSSRST